MFSNRDLAFLDPKYFHIIVKGRREITLQSQNTGHYWYLRSTGMPGERAVLIYHKHRCSHPYHMHGQSSSLKKAVRSIVQHDRFQLEKECRAAAAM